MPATSIKISPGDKFGLLTAVKFLRPNYKQDGTRNGEIWLFQCKCGSTMEAIKNNVFYGSTKSCGCYHKSAVTTHGESCRELISTEYRVWLNMKSRVLNPKAPNYHRYGGRGITICDEWRNSFEKFLKDMGRRPLGRSLDRIDNSCGYSPENCRWATPSEQNLNRSVSVPLTFNGITKTATEWAREVGIVSPPTVHGRLKNGWPPEMAVSCPPFSKLPDSSEELGLALGKAREGLLRLKI